MRVIWQYGDTYADLTDAIVEHLAQQPGYVLWLSESGTVQFFLSHQGELTRIRLGQPWASHAFDGLPLPVHEPFAATSCGCWDGSGYQSTRPLLVAEIARGEDLTDAVVQQIRDLEGSELTTPRGHPEQPCGAKWCYRSAYPSPSRK